MRLNKLIWGSASAIVLAGLAVGGTAFAQDATQTDVLDEIVVTAQKREQRLQDVPITVTVASKQLLDDAGVNDIKDLQILTPGLTVTSTTTVGSTTARIRGIGTVGDNPGLESSVGVVIDGVYRPRNGVGFGDLGQVSRIEVLKGPQGTLFGKNTSAGVISVVTAQPSFTPGGEAEVTVGSYDARGASIYLTGPILGDKAAGSIYGVIRKRDGFLDVSTPAAAAGAASRNNKANDEDYYSLRGQVLTEISDSTSARLIVDYTKRQEDCCLATQLAVGQQLGSTSPTVQLQSPDRARSPGLILNDLRPGSLDATDTPFDRVAYANRSSNQNITDKGVSLQIDSDLSDSLSLTSITAFREWENVFSMEADYTAADLLYRPDDGTNGNKFRQASQELRLAGETGPLTWLGGLFYADEKLNSNQVLLTGADFYEYVVTRSLSSVPALAITGFNNTTVAMADSGTRDIHVQDAKTSAVFANGDLALGGLTLTLGLRYTKDKKSLDSTYTTTGATCALAMGGYGPNGLRPGIRAAITPLTTAGTTQTAVANTIVSKLCSNQFNAAFDALSAGAPLHQTIDDDNVSGTFKAAYRLNDTFMGYASYSRGNKAAGFNLDRAPLVTGIPGPIAGVQPATVSQVFGANPDTRFGEEIADSYELGGKFTFSRDLLVNIAAFDQKFENFQYNTFAGTSFVVTSLPEVTTKGVDLDLFYNIPDLNLSLQGGVTYAETTIGNFTPTPTGFPAGVGPSFSRLPNNTLSFSPKVSATLAMTHTKPLAEGWELRSNLSGKYMGDYNTGSDLNPIKQQDAFFLFNGRVALASTDDKFAVELWVNNLTGEKYIQVGFNGPYQAGDTASYTPAQNDAVSVYDAFLGAPRTAGLTVRSKF